LRSSEPLVIDAVRDDLVVAGEELGDEVAGRLRDGDQSIQSALERLEDVLRVELG
jgi:hypothetical protein